MFLLVWASICALSGSFINAVDASDSDVDCPGPGEAFVTTCSGPESAAKDSPSASPETEELENLVDEVLEESMKSGSTSTSGDFDSDKSGSGDGDDDAAAEGSPAMMMRQMKRTTTELVQKYYDPLPRPGKCAIGTACGFVASRLSLGVANRLFRLAGATWVLSEVMHTSGFCEEATCVPEEARPWIGILRRTLVKRLVKVRMIARGIWDQDRIREIAQKDEMVAGGFAAGAFIGFVA